MLGVVVGLGRLVGVAGQVEAGEALHPLAVGGVPRLAQPLLEQAVVALAVVQRVEAGRVLLVVHAVAAQLGDGGLRLRVLPDVAFDALPVQVVDVARPAERVEVGKGGDVLRRVVGAVQPAPARYALQIALLVEVAVVEDPARLGDGVDQVPLQQRPARRRHRFADGDHRTPIPHARRQRKARPGHCGRFIVQIRCRRRRTVVEMEIGAFSVSLAVQGPARGAGVL